MKELLDGAELNKAAFPRVERIKALIGASAVLLHWPLGTKGTRRKWGHLTLADTIAVAYLRKLERGNIGVALGAKSDGLCTIDWDDDEWVEPFIELNPSLSRTLRTRGARGCNFWLRLTSAYPASGGLRFNGKDVGEWRANGLQTIIDGLHPTGIRYTMIVEAPPLEVDFASIVWPEGMKTPLVGKSVIVHSNAVYSATQAPQRSQESQATQAPQCSQGTQVGVVRPLLFSVDTFIPTGSKQSDGLLWMMAREVRKWERDNGRKTERADADTMFEAWWKGARAHVDSTKGYSAFHAKWIADWKSAKCPSDECALSTAWRAAQTEPLPPEASLLHGGERMPDEMQRLVALCFHLQRIRGKEPFFLGSRDAEKLVGGHKHSTFHLWLEALSDPEGKLRVLEKVSVGSMKAHLTNEWRYLPLMAQA